MNDHEAEALVREVAESVRDRRVLDAIRDVPRERFVDAALRRWAYVDAPLPIGEGQTISQPTIVGMMTEALRLTGREHVLEIGTGCGYQAAILARLARDVVSVEIVDVLRLRAAETLRALGVRNVLVLPAGDDLGAPDHAPFDAIVVTAAAAEVPPPLIAQLRVGGRLVIPVGETRAQELLVVTRTAEGFTQQSLGGCRFVPLVGPHGLAERRPPRQPALPSTLAELRAQLHSADCGAVRSAARELAAARVVLAEDDLALVRRCIDQPHQHAGQRAALVHDYLLLHGERAGPLAAVALLRDGDPVEQQAAVHACVDLGAAALPPLAALAHEADRDRRWLAYDVIRQIDGPAAVEMLVGGLADDDYSIRWVASHGLIDAGAAAYLPVLQAIAGRRPSTAFHEAAGRVVVRMRAAGAEAQIAALASALTRSTTVVESGPLALALIERLRRAQA